MLFFGAAGYCVCSVKSDLCRAGKDNGRVSGVLDIKPKGVMIIEDDIVDCVIKKKNTVIFM